MPGSVDVASGGSYSVAMRRRINASPQRVAAMQPFLAMEMMERAFALQRDGAPVVHLGLGEPDFAAPPAVIRACSEALARGQTRYEESRGLPALREAIAADLERRFGVGVSPQRVLVTNGTSPAMLVAFSLLLEPGDEVVLAAPHYPCYPNFIRYCQGVPVTVETHPEAGWRLDAAAVRQVVGPKTRAIVVGSPANPTGAVQDETTLRELASLGPVLVSDEVYDGIVYDGVRVTSSLQVSSETFALDGFSKRYAMTGFRLGWMVVPEWAVRPAQILQQNLFICANAFVQRAGLEALASGASAVKEMCEVYAVRRERLASGLRELGFDVPGLPEGAFYIFAGARRFGSDSLALARALLERAHVSVAPGCDFGEAGEGSLRFCFAVSEDAIDTAIERMARILPELESEAGARARGENS